jgi:hypothetical protein
MLYELRMLYVCYEKSIIVLYRMLNCYEYCMSVTKDLLLR